MAEESLCDVSLGITGIHNNEEKVYRKTGKLMYIHLDGMIDRAHIQRCIVRPRFPCSHALTFRRIDWMNPMHLGPVIATRCERSG